MSAEKEKLREGRFGARTTDRAIRPADARSRRRTLGAVVALVTLLLLVGVPAFAAYRILFVPDTNDITPGVSVRVEIPAGAGTAEIARMLATVGVIENASMFRLRARLEGIDGKLRTGIYDLTTGMSYEAAVEKLLVGPPLTYVTVTIPEGFTIEQIAGRIEDATGISAEEIVALGYGQAVLFVDRHPYLADAYDGSLEGFLFPKTYRVVEGSTAEDVIELMLDQFDTELASVDLSYATERGLSLSDVVTIASMVEREARVADERPLVASVIYNRLEKGMRLEIDATIEYVIKENRPRLLLSDLEIDSPYNTYRNAGLPPGPIASPGLASLQAAAEPADTAFIYYVLTSADGSHTFTETYEEFLIAKEKSREVTP
ncbi:MAG: endolytic transglycosylase MltG [Coriobacteriia bacterium]|nr:endolytic transglycosylase MltG [Coriobacteriia bacterium]